MPATGPQARAVPLTHLPAPTTRVRPADPATSARWNGLALQAGLAPAPLRAAPTEALGALDLPMLAEAPSPATAPVLAPMGTEAVPAAPTPVLALEAVEGPVGTAAPEEPGHEEPLFAGLLFVAAAPVVPLPTIPTVKEGAAVPEPTVPPVPTAPVSPGAEWRLLEVPNPVPRRPSVAAKPEEGAARQGVQVPRPWERPRAEMRRQAPAQTAVDAPPTAASHTRSEAAFAAPSTPGPTSIERSGPAPARDPDPLPPAEVVVHSPKRAHLRIEMEDGTKVLAQVRVEDRRVEVEFRAAPEQAQQLRTHAPELREALAGHRLELSRVDVQSDRGSDTPQRQDTLAWSSPDADRHRATPDAPPEELDDAAPESGQHEPSSPSTPPAPRRDSDSLVDLRL